MRDSIYFPFERLGVAADSRTIFNESLAPKALAHTNPNLRTTQDAEGAEGRARKKASQG
jgi:hypothetical protein